MTSYILESFFFAPAMPKASVNMRSGEERVFGIPMDLGALGILRIPKASADGGVASWDGSFSVFLLPRKGFQKGNDREPRDPLLQKGNNRES